MLGPKARNLSRQLPLLSTIRPGRGQSPSVIRTPTFHRCRLCDRVETRAQPFLQVLCRSILYEDGIDGGNHPLQRSRNRHRIGRNKHNPPYLRLPYHTIVP